MIEGRGKADRKGRRRLLKRRGSKKSRKFGDLKAQSHENFQYFSDKRLIVNSFDDKYFFWDNVCFGMKNHGAYIFFILKQRGLRI